MDCCPSLFFWGLKSRWSANIPNFFLKKVSRTQCLSQRVIVPGNWNRETVTTWLANQKQQDSSVSLFKKLSRFGWFPGYCPNQYCWRIVSSSTCLIPSLGWLKYWSRMRAIVLGERKKGAETAEKIEFKFWISVCFKHSNREQFWIHTRTHWSTYNL